MQGNDIRRGREKQIQAKDVSESRETPDRTETKELRGRAGFELLSVSVNQSLYYQFNVNSCPNKTANGFNTCQNIL